MGWSGDRVIEEVTAIEKEEWSGADAGTNLLGFELSHFTITRGEEM